MSEQEANQTSTLSDSNVLDGAAPPVVATAEPTPPNDGTAQPSAPLAPVVLGGEPAVVEPVEAPVVVEAVDPAAGHDYDYTAFDRLNFDEAKAVRALFDQTGAEADRFREFAAALAAAVDTFRA